MQWNTVCPDVLEEPVPPPPFDQVRSGLPAVLGAVRPQPATAEVRLQGLHEEDPEAVPDHHSLTVKQVESMKVLGSWIDHSGCARHSLSLNQAACGKKYWSLKCLHSRAVRNHGHCKQLIAAYLKHLQPILLWGSEAWPLSDGLLEAIEAWESSFLLHMMGGT